MKFKIQVGNLNIDQSPFSLCCLRYLKSPLSQSVLLFDWTESDGYKTTRF